MNVCIVKEHITPCRLARVGRRYGELTVSIFRVEQYAKQEISMKQTATVYSCVRNVISHTQSRLTFRFHEWDFCFPLSTCHVLMWAHGSAIFIADGSVSFPTLPSQTIAHFMRKWGYIKTTYAFKTCVCGGGGGYPINISWRYSSDQLPTDVILCHM
jgi:hypothetical protein